MKQYLVHYAVHERCDDAEATSELHGVVYKRSYDTTEIIAAPSASYILQNFTKENITYTTYTEVLAISCLDN